MKTRDEIVAIIVAALKDAEPTLSDGYIYYGAMGNEDELEEELKHIAEDIADKILAS